MSALARAGLWAASSAALLFGGWFALCAFLTRSLPPEVQREFFRVISLQALAPLWAATLASLVALARVAPAVEHGFGRASLAIALLASLWFVPVGVWLFDAWSPSGLSDWLRTWLLLVAAVGAALLLPRRLLPWLAPGGFAPEPPRAKVAQ
jgi:hypothetical protein